MLFQNICSASRVQNCWNLAKTRVRTKKNMPCAQMLHIKIAGVIYMPGAKNLNQFYGHLIALTCFSFSMNPVRIHEGRGHSRQNYFCDTEQCSYEEKWTAYNY